MCKITNGKKKVAKVMYLAGIMIVLVVAVVAVVSEHRAMREFEKELDEMKRALN